MPVGSTCAEAPAPRNGVHMLFCIRLRSTSQSPSLMPVFTRPPHCAGQGRRFRSVADVAALPSVKPSISSCHCSRSSIPGRRGLSDVPAPSALFINGRRMGTWWELAAGSKGSGEHDLRHAAPSVWLGARAIPGWCSGLGHAMAARDAGRGSWHEGGRELGAMLLHPRRWQTRVWPG